MTKNQMKKMSDTAIDKSVKIIGTNYDRRRKVTKDMKRRMKQMEGAGKSFTEIAKHFGVSRNTVKYNLDEEFAKKQKADRKLYARNCFGYDGYVANRIEYKKSLIEAGKRL